MTNDLPKKSEISDISWNSNGTYLAVCYYINNHIGPCAHQMSINIFQFEDLNKEKYFKNKINIEVNCIKAIEAHPKKSNIFAFCTYLGEISLINLNNEKDQIQFTSKIDSYFHKELIVAIKWIDLYRDGNYVKKIKKFISFFLEFSLHIRRWATINLVIGGQIKFSFNRIFYKNQSGEEYNTNTPNFIC